MPKTKSYMQKHGVPAIASRSVARPVNSGVRMDNWENTITGLNVSGVDKRVSATPQALLLKENDAEALYHSDGLAQKCVDTLPEDMLREGFSINSPELTAEQIAAAMTYAEETLNWRALFKQALSWADLYGGSAIILGVDAGASLDQPLDLATGTVSTFTFGTVLSRYELIADTIQDDPALPGYGLPATYKMKPAIKATSSPAADKTDLVIHASRLLIFQGAPLARKEFIKNGYWGDSVLSKMFRPLQNYSTSHDSVASLMQDFSQAVFKIKNLADILSSKDGKALIRERINMVELSRSVIKATLLADGEEFERKATPLTGIENILRKFEERLTATSGYPHTVLLGEAPGGGIGNDGQSQHRDYYDFVARRQKSHLKQNLKRFMLCILKASQGPVNKMPVVWDLKFNPLWQESQKEIIGQRESQAKIDQVYIENQVLSPEEVALARFGSGSGYSHDTKLLIERTTDGGGGDDSDPAAPPAE